MHCRTTAGRLPRHRWLVEQCSHRRSPFRPGRGGCSKFIDECGCGRNLLYREFESEDDLVVAYLERCQQEWTAIMDGAVDPFRDDPARQLVAMVRAVARQVAAPDFHGCPFRTTHAQFPNPCTPLTGWPSDTSRGSGLSFTASRGKPEHDTPGPSPTGWRSSSTAPMSTARCSAPGGRHGVTLGHRQDGPARACSTRFLRRFGCASARSDDAGDVEDDADRERDRDQGDDPHGSPDVRRRLVVDRRGRAPVVRWSHSCPPVVVAELDGRQQP